MDPEVRELVRHRADGHCEYCRLSQEHAAFVRFQIEHIIPKKHGGGDEQDNLALACPHCNRHKGPNLTGIDPQSRDIVPLFHPRKQAWRDHFAMQDVRVTGLTPTGRATIRVLNMNAEDRLKVRTELQTRGELLL